MNRAETIEFLIERANSSRNRGPLAKADVVAAGGNPHCGDVVKVYVNVDSESEAVTAMTFEAEGCTISRAAASLLSEMAPGMSLAELEALDYNRMIDALGRDVVRSRPGCATLALSTLKTAVKKYRTRKGAAATDGEAASGEASVAGAEDRPAACRNG